MANPRWDETWHRLREWTSGQGPSERLAAQVLVADGYTSLDPSHPLGGPDGGKDGLCMKDGQVWSMAVYFPRGRQPFAAIRGKFLQDLEGARSHVVHGMAFVTNQEISLGERKELLELASPTNVDLYHLERITVLLDSAPMAATRKQFLGIDYADPTATEHVVQLHNEVMAAHRRLEAVQTGGDTFCYLMFFHFDMTLSIAQNFVIIKNGQFPLYDVRLRIYNVHTARNLLERPWGEISAPAEFLIVKWPLPPRVHYRVFFHARNGQWNQDLILRRSERAECWLAATQVKAPNGRDVVLTHVDGGFIDEFGPPGWCS